VAQALPNQIGKGESYTSFSSRPTKKATTSSKEERGPFFLFILIAEGKGTSMVKKKKKKSMEKGRSTRCHRKTRRLAANQIGYRTTEKDDFSIKGRCTITCGRSSGKRTRKKGILTVGAGKKTESYNFETEGPSPPSEKKRKRTPLLKNIAVKKGGESFSSPARQKVCRERLPALWLEKENSRHCVKGKTHETQGGIWGHAEEETVCITCAAGGEGKKGEGQ